MARDGGGSGIDGDGEIFWWKREGEGDFAEGLDLKDGCWSEGLMGCGGGNESCGCGG